jgi:protein gp37
MMGYPTPIEWTDATWNPIGGCSIESPGCADCYAQKLAGTRLKNHPLYRGTTTLVKGKPVFNGKLTNMPLDHPTWSWPLRWRGAGEAKVLGPGKPSLIFVGDMSDLYHPERPFAVVDLVVAPIVYSRHIGQLLTKRPDMMLVYFWELHATSRWYEFVHAISGKPNFDASAATFENAIVPRLWLGMSAERQKEFDERWPALRKLAGMGFTVFVSYEPALGPLVLPADFLALGRRAGQGRVQVIAGGKSGAADAPAHPDWFRAVRDQCEAAGVAFFLKQWGEWIPQSESSHPGIRADQSLTMTEGEIFYRVGKKAAGRLLDGREHNGFPALAP